MFRSDLERRYAEFFDAMNWDYEYEREVRKLRAGWYLPDFELCGGRLIFEVKPEMGMFDARHVELAESGATVWVSDQNLGVQVLRCEAGRLREAISCRLAWCAKCNLPAAIPDDCEARGISLIRTCEAWRGCKDRCCLDFSVQQLSRFYGALPAKCGEADDLGQPRYGGFSSVWS